jgi:hypothetical protein
MNIANRKNMARGTHHLNHIKIQISIMS